MKANILKRVIASALLLTVTASFAACGKTESTTATTAAAGSDTQSEANADVSANVVLKVGANITPNTGVIEGSLDANYFQHVPYLEQFNKENNSTLVSVGAVHYEPFGIYAGKTKDLKDLPDGATVAVPNNVTNEARALLLLAQEGIIKLKDDAGINATVEDITENPKNIKFKELAPEQLVAALPDVDVAVINGNYAIEGGLHVSQALAVEANDGLAAQTYGNIIATSAEKANDPATYDGAVVPLF